LRGVGHVELELVATILAPADYFDELSCFHWP
jgi:hypothetical protein